MTRRDKGVFRILSKKYAYNMLKKMEEGPKRFKEFSDVCRIEKMRSQRLKEFEKLNLIKVNIKREGRRVFPVYELSDTGKKTLKLAEDIMKLYKVKK